VSQLITADNFGGNLLKDVRYQLHLGFRLGSEGLRLGFELGLDLGCDGARPGQARTSAPVKTVFAMALPRLAA
jgi:hypothetical protein